MGGSHRVVGLVTEDRPSDLSCMTDIKLLLSFPHNNCRKENSFYDEMANFVNQAFGNGKGDVSQQATFTLYIWIY